MAATERITAPSDFLEKLASAEESPTSLLQMWKPSRLRKVVRHEKVIHLADTAQVRRDMEKQYAASLARLPAKAPAPAPEPPL